MSRVVAALKPDHPLRVLGQPVDDLALTFIAPLRADDDDVLAHVLSQARELAQIQRESGGGARAAERLADAVVALAAADRVWLTRREYREAGAVLVVVAAQVCEIDVQSLDGVARGGGEGF